MLNVIGFIRKNSGLLIAGLFCLALWGLNTRNGQLTATNQRLEQMADRKDNQILDLRSKNDGLAASVSDLVNAVNKQSEVMTKVADQRAVTAEQNRKLQNEIKQYLAADKCAATPVPGGAADRLREAARAASGVQDNKATTSKTASVPDKPH